MELSLAFLQEVLREVLKRELKFLLTVNLILPQHESVLGNCFLPALGFQGMFGSGNFENWWTELMIHYPHRVPACGFI